MPFMLEKTRWNREPSRPIGNDGVTRGCSKAWPDTTRPAAASKCGRLSGCAILPIRRWTVSRGSLRVGIERYDVANAGGHAWGLPADAEKAGVDRATQQPVQFMQLAALAFPADPS